MTAFYLVGSGLQRAVGVIFGEPAPDDMRFLALALILFAIDSAVALAALQLVCRWRMKRSLLPANMFWAEMLVGLAFGGAYFLALVFIRATSDPNW